ncbi:hypothetical protein ACWF94_39895 [Streptomyces sp. NPDC055078]
MKDTQLAQRGVDHAPPERHAVSLSQPPRFGVRLCDLERGHRFEGDAGDPA